MDHLNLWVAAFKKFIGQLLNMPHTKAYLEPCQISKMGRFAKIANGF